MVNISTLKMIPFHYNIYKNTSQRFDEGCIHGNTKIQTNTLRRPKGGHTLGVVYPLFCTMLKTLPIRSYLRNLRLVRFEAWIQNSGWELYILILMM